MLKGFRVWERELGKTANRRGATQEARESIARRVREMWPLPSHRTLAPIAPLPYPSWERGREGVTGTEGGAQEEWEEKQIRVLYDRRDTVHAWRAWSRKGPGGGSIGGEAPWSTVCLAFGCWAGTSELPTSGWWKAALKKARIPPMAPPVTSLEANADTDIVGGGYREGGRGVEYLKEHMSKCLIH